MIRKIEVSGFKTLSGFVMELKPGLDILVGPNGSGKTNIISFFEFLGLLQDMNVSDAISSAGGAGYVFRKTGEESYETNISAKITGSVRVRSGIYIFYKYQFKIHVPESGESIVYSSQRLMIKRRSVDSIDEKRISNYDVDVKTFIGDDLKSHTNIYKCTPKVLGVHLSSHEKEHPENYKKRLEFILKNFMPLDQCIVGVLRFIENSSYWQISSDIRGGQVYNIEPSRAKTPDDSAKKPGVNKDGSGLYSTLYAIKKREEYGRKRIIPFMFDDNLVSDAKLADILKYIQLANEWISDIVIINNPFDRQLQIRVSIMGNKQTSVLPLSAMSDGTVKWISLITIILTNPTMFSIEEPENYLHPLMLSEIISIIRTHMKRDRFVLMSTHSETLINNATPDEIVVVSYVKGKTIAKRISNAEQLSNEIRKTGFGLGYYYISGNFDHE